MCTSTPVISTPGNRHCTLAFRHHTSSSNFAILKFKRAHLGIWPQTDRQTDIHTHAGAQCSHACVGLAQARPNYGKTQTLIRNYSPVYTRCLTQIPIRIKLIRFM